VDIAPRDAGIAVVRAIVPKLETYMVDGRVGPALRAILGRHADSFSRAEGKRTLSSE
jgi:hypothetical protein